MAEPRLAEGAAAAPVRRLPVVLIASTTQWGGARVAVAFAELGCHVEAIAWHGSTMAHTRAVRRIHRYDWLRPLVALSRAIARVAPDLVVPCDDRAVEHLQALRGRPGTPPCEALTALLDRSLGNAWAAGGTGGRAAFMALAREEGVRAPLTLPVEDAAAFRDALDRVGLPAMLKVDGTWGGTGVARADSLADAERRFALLSRSLSLPVALKRLVVNRDPFWLLPWLRRTRPRVNVQAVVPGRPANCLVSCWKGEVLASIQVEVGCAGYETGPAAVVRSIEHPEMAESVRRVVHRCGLSGFCGFDFMIDDTTGALYLIEMNQRMTPVGHLCLGEGRDPVGALVARYIGQSGPLRARATACDTVAFFPQAWRLDPASPDLSAAYHDVPWTEPDLVRELVRQSWRERGWAVALFRRLRKAREPPVARWDLPSRPRRCDACSGSASDDASAAQDRPQDANLRMAVGVGGPADLAVPQRREGKGFP